MWPKKKGFGSLSECRGHFVAAVFCHCNPFFHGNLYIPYQTEK